MNLLAVYELKDKNEKLIKFFNLFNNSMFHLFTISYEIINFNKVCLTCYILIKLRTYIVMY